MSVVLTGGRQFIPSGGDTKRVQAAETELGTIAYDRDTGAEYIYVKAGAVIAVNSAVVLNAGMADVRASSATQQGVIGIATAAFASGDYGFIYHRGGQGAVCKLVAATAANAVLATTATGGTLGTGAATDVNQRSAVCSVAESGGLGTVILL